MPWDCKQGGRGMSDRGTSVLLSDWPCHWHHTQGATLVRQLTMDRGGKRVGMAEGAGGGGGLLHGHQGHR